MNSLNIQIRLIGLNEKTSLFKNLILNKFIHKCLHKRNKSVNIDFCFIV